MESAKLPISQKELSHLRAEFVIVRVNPDKRITHDRDADNGFVVRGPGIEEGRIRFEKWSPGDAEAETPWGQMFVRLEPSRKMKWRVTGVETEVLIEVSYKSILDLALLGDSSNLPHFRLKNRTLFRKRIYEYKHAGGRVSIITDTNGFFYEERNKRWTIRFSGDMTSIMNAVLPALAVFLCYYKVYRGFLSERGRWQSIFLPDGMF